jgi:transcriptional regulator with XRE-family HTH domain
MFHMRNITGSQIRLARQSNKLTQEELAARLQILGFGHTRNTIAKIESGIRQVTDVELKAFAQALSVNIGWFFQEHNHANP